MRIGDPGRYRRTVRLAEVVARPAPTCPRDLPVRCTGGRMPAECCRKAGNEAAMSRHDTDRSYLVKDKAASAAGDSRAMRRRPPCRNFGGDARSRELTDRITQTTRRIAGEQRELLRDIAELDRSEAWRGDGAVSMTAWVTRHCRVRARRRHDSG